MEKQNFALSPTKALEKLAKIENKEEQIKFLKSVELIGGNDLDLGIFVYRLVAITKGTLTLEELFGAVSENDELTSELDYLFSSVDFDWGLSPMSV